MVARALLAAALCASFSGIAFAETLASDRCNPCPGAANTNDVILEAREVSRLSDRMQAAEVALKGWKLKGKRVAEFKERQEKSLKAQIKTREHIAQISDKDADEHKVAKKQQLVHQMCTLVFQAFLHDGDEDAKTKLVKLCMGRDDLALAGTKAKLLRGKREEPAVELTDEEEALASSPKVQKMQKELDEVDAKVKEARDSYYEDQVKFGEERESLSDDEDELGDEASDLAEDKWASSGEAWEEVKEDWCPPFNSGEDAAIAYAKDNCN